MTLLRCRRILTSGLKMAKLPTHVVAFGIQDGLYFSAERREMLGAGGHAGKLCRRQSHVNGCVLRVGAPQRQKADVQEFSLASQQEIAP